MKNKRHKRRGLWWAAHERRTPPALRDDAEYMAALWAFHSREAERLPWFDPAIRLKYDGAWRQIVEDQLRDTVDDVMRYGVGSLLTGVEAEEFRVKCLSYYDTHKR